MIFVDQEKARQFFRRLHEEVPGPGKVYLVGEIMLVVEGWRRWTDEIELHVEVEQEKQFHDRLNRICKETGVAVYVEFPGDVIPLPDQYDTRARPVEAAKIGLDQDGTGSGLQFYHFDPYSVAFRYIARGDEQDYQLVLTLMQHGWIDRREMDRLLEGLLPRFTFKTIQQDPAEFRRKYKGLMQMWAAVQSHAQEAAQRHAQPSQQ